MLVLMQFVSINGRAFTPLEIEQGKAYNGVMWEAVSSPHLLPAIQVRTELDLAMAIWELYQQLRRTR